MHVLPPKCRASLHNVGCTVAGKVVRSKGTKPAKTCLARQEHSLVFCQGTHINDPCVDLPHPSSQNYFLACYAISLIQGKTISSTTIQSSTVKNYVNASCNLFTNKGLPLPHSCKADFINIIMCKLWNFKTIPVQLNTITNKMTLWMTNHIPTLPPTYSFVAFFDWIVLSCYAGFRTLEWCQTSPPFLCNLQ